MIEKPSIAAGARISTVVPGKARGEESEDRALTNMDLAMKLHYIRGVYFFENADDYLPSLMMRIEEVKQPMFTLLDHFFVTAGRVRRFEDAPARAGGGGGGRPYIKCNDAGVRIVEASSDKTVEEWFRALEEGGRDLEDNCHGGLCYDHGIGPDLGFSPLVYLQFTRFKCGGFSVGLSWAHLLGDVLSASTFINTWAQIMAGHVPQKPTHVPSREKTNCDSKRLAPKKPMSLKELEPVGNHWQITANGRQNMKTHSFRVTFGQLDLSISNACGNKASNFAPFEIISAVIWKSLSRIRENLGPQVVTICCYDSRGKEDSEIPNNKGMVLGTVEADALESDVSELALRIAKKRTVENDAIDKMVGQENGTVDYLVYGANLTFVNLEEIGIYELEVKGQRPVFANYTIGGVGEEGLVMVLPLGPSHGEKKDTNGRTITVVLPEDQLALLKNELKEHWNIS